MRLTSPAPEADIHGASQSVRFADNGICAVLFGQHHMNVARIEQRLPVSIVTRGNEVFIRGEADEAVASAVEVLRSLYALLEQGHVIGREDVDAALRMAADSRPEAGDGHFQLRTHRRSVKPRSPNQAAYLSALDRHDLVFALGPAGTGKTYLAVAAAVAMLRERRIDRLVLSRPAVEAGERLGFLPGDLKEKVDPYLRPLYDALHDMLPEGKLAQRFESGQIEIAPLAFMRGRTLSNAFVILDEAQNATAAQMKMFLTRLGEGSRMVVTGDTSQVDLPHGMRSGLVDAVDRLKDVPGIATVRFDRGDVVRHPLVAMIVDAYDRDEGGSGGERADRSRSDRQGE